MKKTKCITAILLALLMFMFSGCSLNIQIKGISEPLPSDTIEEFEKAVNNMDVQGMLDCMSEDMQDSLTSVLNVGLGIISAITGTDITKYISAEDLLNISPLLQMFVSYDDMGQMVTVDYKTDLTYIKGDKATVYFTDVSTGQQQVINMVKENDKWVFSMTTTLLSADEAERIINADGEVTVTSD